MLHRNISGAIMMYHESKLFPWHVAKAIKAIFYIPLKASELYRDWLISMAEATEKRR